jgi:hypothetical protein
VGRVANYLRLSPSDRRLLVEAGFLVVLIRLGLWLFPFRALRRILARMTYLPSLLRDKHPVSTDRIAWAVERTSRYVPAATCLTQALAAQVLMRRRGFAVCLRIGVAKDEREQLIAHAWVETEGKVVVGRSGYQRYTPFPALDGDNC